MFKAKTDNTPSARNAEDAYLRMSCLQQAAASREVLGGSDVIAVAKAYYDFVTGSQSNG